jgi:hypothetical protein
MNSKYIYKEDKAGVIKMYIYIPEKYLNNNLETKYICSAHMAAQFCKYGT